MNSHTEQEAAGKWLPIESAPEDDAVLIYTTSGWIDTAYYVADEDTGERIWEWFGAGKIHPKHTPTHWMPLPDPPEPQP